MNQAGQWISDRLPVSGNQLLDLANEPIPYHFKRWWFALGSTPAYLFVLQVVTGIVLAFYYKPAPETAYESVRYITDEAAFGWYLRSVHKWAGTLMIAAVVLHQMRVFFTSAYRRPREINWVIGTLLLFGTLMLGFTGYSLVYEQLSFWGATVGANIAETVPVVGGFLKTMLLGGEAYNSRTLARFFILHVLVLPIVMMVLVVIHIVIVRLQGLSPLAFEEDSKRGRKSFDLLPEHLYTEITIGLFLMVLLGTLAAIAPATMGPPADPSVTPEVIKPEWFFFVAFRWLKLFTGTAALLSMAGVVLAMLFWPFIDQRIRRRTRFQEASVWIGVCGVLAILGLTLWEAISKH